MNTDRRKQIKSLIARLEASKSELEDIRSDIQNLEDEEQEYFDNMPESLQGGDKGQRAEEVISLLQDAGSDADSLVESIDEVTEKLDEAAE